MQFHACGCQPHYRHRTKRSLWMKLLPRRRLFECIECGARMLLNVKSPWPAYTGLKPNLGPTWHPDPRLLTRVRQSRPAPLEAVLPVLVAELAARAVIAAHQAQVSQVAASQAEQAALAP